MQLKLVLVNHDLLKDGKFNDMLAAGVLRLIILEGVEVVVIPLQFCHYLLKVFVHLLLSLFLLSFSLLLLSFSSLISVTACYLPAFIFLMVIFLEVASVIEVISDPLSSPANVQLWRCIVIMK